ncbi:MAG: SDR family NAD(P)-dependent oxidoreductase [Baekduia sp.]
MSRSYRDCVCVITGSGSGIGRSLALQLGAQGAIVELSDVDAARADAVAAEITAAGGTATATQLDVTDADAVGAYAERVFADHGRVDLLCNNAGVGHAGGVVETPLEDWHRVIDVNLYGVIHGLHHFVPKMIETGRPGTIINTASLAGLVAAQDMAPYSATKFAVVGISESLDLELKEHGIRVSALCPGFIDTDIVRTSTVRGEMAERHEGLTRFYATRGTSPDVVARQALAAAGRKRIIPSPRHQVATAWLAQRYAPALGRAITSAFTKRVGR